MRPVVSGCSGDNRRIVGVRGEENEREEQTEEEEEEEDENGGGFSSVTVRKLFGTYKEILRRRRRLRRLDDPLLGSGGSFSEGHEGWPEIQRREREN